MGLEGFKSVSSQREEGSKERQLAEGVPQSLADRLLREGRAWTGLEIIDESGMSYEELRQKLAQIPDGQFGETLADRLDGRLAAFIALYIDSDLEYFIQTFGARGINEGEVVRLAKIAADDKNYTNVHSMIRARFNLEPKKEAA